MKAEIKHYWFNISCPEQEKEYQELRNTLRKTVKKAMPHRGSSKLREVTEVTLDPKYLFDNQWNTKEGYRVMEWQYSVHENKDIKEGYYLILPKEAVELRERKRKCGFCSEMSDVEGPHLKCAESKYMSKDNLHLAYFGKIQNPEYPEPTEEVIQAFTESRKRLALAEVQRRIVDAEKAFRDAQWVFSCEKEMIELGFYDLENVIYYSHKKKFSVGWRKPLTLEETLLVKEMFKDTSFDWEFHK